MRKTNHRLSEPARPSSVNRRLPPNAAGPRQPTVGLMGAPIPKPRHAPHDPLIWRPIHPHPPPSNHIK